MKTRSLLSQDKIWSKFSNDKVDIGERLAKVIRTLEKAAPLNRPLRGLSIGSSNEPQFRILQSHFGGGLYLLDIDRTALSAVRERVFRQKTKNVRTITKDFKKIFLDAAKTKAFLQNKLGGKKVDLITLEHSLYYSEESEWPRFIENLYRYLLAPTGAIHCVLMASRSRNPSTTTWLYNYFAGKFFGHKNDQSLPRFKRELRENPVFKRAQILSAKSHVHFWAGSFRHFMAVVWMILLYPHIHPYSPSQRKEIAHTISRRFFRKKSPLIQEQDHLVIYRGIPFKGLI
ncbi:MAG TPA: class I SAM-dependent methyltransferase [Candidatus Omnitrophota bacterium]|nr:class I SAM-dependent methyltransferase [Candidatus Omnitrophota bacterium]